MPDPLVSASATFLGAKAGLARIEVERSSGCGACAQKPECAPIQRLNLLTLDVPVESHREASMAPGDRVVLSIGRAALAKMMVVCYLVPAVLMLAGASLGCLTIGDSDLMSLAGAALGLMVGCALLRLYDSRVGYPLDPMDSKQSRPSERNFPIILTEP